MPGPQIHSKPAIREPLCLIRLLGRRAGAPKPVLDKFHADIVRVMHVGELTKEFANLGMDAVSSTPEQFLAFMRADVAKYAKLIKDAGIEVQ